MHQHIKSIIELCMFKGSPENLPYSRNIFIVMIALHLVFYWAGLNELPNIAGHHLWAITLLWMGCNLSLVYGLLYFKGIKERWFKVMFALVSVEVFFLIIIRFGRLIFGFMPFTNVSIFLVNMALICIFLIKARIFKIALETKFWVGMLCAIVIEMLANIPGYFLLMDVLKDLKY